MNVKRRANAAVTARSARAVRRAAATAVEVLEERRLMTVAFAEGGLVVTGTANADNIVVETQSIGVSGFVEVRVKENGSTTLPWTAFATFMPLKVKGLGGNDKIDCSKSAVAVTVEGGNGADTITGGSGADKLFGNAGADNLTGNGGNDTLDGGTEDDWMRGGAGADVFKGGAGKDFANYDERTETLIITLDGQANDGTLLSGEFDNVNKDVEGVIGGKGNDIIIQGNEFKNQFYGGGGSDNLSGLGDNDVLFGGSITWDEYADNNGRDALNGGDGNDQLWVPAHGSAEMKGGKGDDLLFGQNGSDTLYGDANDDKLYGGDGQDTLYGGTGEDELHGGEGNDVLMAVGGGTKDKLWGDGGVDSFWRDAQNPSVEKVYDSIGDSFLADHAVSKFHDYDINPDTNNLNKPASQHIAVSKEANGENLADPIDTEGHHWEDFSDERLFPSGGPFVTDIDQGAVGDCWFASAIGAANIDHKSTIRQSIAPMGDGSFAVRFFIDDEEQFYRVDGDLPVDANGNLIYLKQGDDGSIYAPILEKAFAFARSGQGSYASLESGPPTEAFRSLGFQVVSWFAPEDYSSGAELLEQIDELLYGYALTFATRNDVEVESMAPVVKSHAYTVTSIKKNANGGLIGVTIRNPWGHDGAGNDNNPNDGYVTLTGQQALNVMSSLCFATSV